MDENEDHFCNGGKIWDLHIHSNCDPSASNEIKDLNISEYLDKLISVIEKYPDLEMISFTDHNRINTELYKEYYDRFTHIALLPGVEIDVKLHDEGSSKHLLVYFDAMNDIERINLISECISDLIGNPTHACSDAIQIESLLSKLVNLNIPFVVSPHAFKQGKRGIDYEWHAQLSEEKDIDIKKYMDQFFCLWEASGNSDIARAITFLEEMACDKKISIVSFSDSRDMKKLESYLNAPTQYFRALPNFNGLKMAGSEITRIVREKPSIDVSEQGKYLGTIEFNGQTISLSSGMNAIIGGRGTGKSLLLDSIANYLQPNENYIDKKRMDFINKYYISINNLNGSRIEGNAFRIDYFKQNYVTKLFEKSDEDLFEELNIYFSSTLNEIEPIPEENIKTQNKAEFTARIYNYSQQDNDNISGLTEKYIIDIEDNLNIALTDEKKKISDEELESLNYSELISNLQETICTTLPSYLERNSAVRNSLQEFLTVVNTEAHIVKQSYLSGDWLYNLIIKIFLEKKSAKSEAQKMKNETIKLFKNLFNEKTNPIREKVSIINAYIYAANNFKLHYENSKIINGEHDNAFRFTRTLDIENPLVHMCKLFDEYFKIQKKMPIDIEHLLSYINIFCYKNPQYKTGKKESGLIKELLEFTLDYENKISIGYMNAEGNYDDIFNLSPGTQANIILEYIVYKDTNIPLLIDQPEDNVDNQTIYEKLRQWFMKLKVRRQMIVVTHDANIVINADAENVIIADHGDIDSFKYDYGALEYNDIIDRASIILDGGKDAVRRRLIKYGE